MRVAVYCGANAGNSPAFADAARSLGELLARAGIGVVYGGASRGLMGLLADAAITAGGEVIGVLPRSLSHREIAHTGLAQLHVVESMHERKLRITELADAFVALPGGIGTMDEFFEALTWAQIGIHDKPIALLNIEDFYAPLVMFLNSMVNAGFLARARADSVALHDSSGSYVESLSRARQAAPPPRYA